MKGKQPKGKAGEVIPFPRLPERLMEKAVSALRSKNHQQALELFQQLSEMDPYNPQASYGLAVCFVELGYYDEAEMLTKEMMEKGIGQYYDVLKLHITVLIQQRKYQSVVDILEAVLEEGDISTANRQNLMQLAEFARRRLSEVQNGSHEESFPTFDLEKWSEELRNGNIEQQWNVFHQCQELKNTDALALFQSYLLDDSGDPLLKSMMLRDLKERGMIEVLDVEKYGETHQVDLSKPLFYEAFAEVVHQKIHDVLASENPTLLDHAAQLWGHFILSFFPLPIQPENPDLWAAACYVMIHHIHG
ncbi:MAG TPA: tetratricopeptide repeat protein, partial [Sporolactobacillaceae bacterium]|nr:tetratricopeptide repeat protein [Sporolactobacillaceae bacterium]